uniref:Uncharacterized protein n=1 Tax=Arundo donax TaxID=35708 RepID=A0A0A9SX04_ARUDO
MYKIQNIFCMFFVCSGYYVLLPLHSMRPHSAFD